METNEEKSSGYSGITGIFKIIAGLAADRSSLEYKQAYIGLQRMSAPLAAVVIPLIAAVILAVVSSVQKSEAPYAVEMATVEDEKLEEVDQLPELPEEVQDSEINPEKMDFATVSDLPAADPVAEAAPSTAPDAARQITSVMTMPSIRAGIGFDEIGDKSGFGGRIAKGGSAVGALIGEIIDLKRDGDGNQRAGAVDSYWKDLKSLVGSRWSESAKSKYMVLPRKVALTHLFIPVQSADNGPKAFGVADLMEPRGWVAHYTGTIRPGKKTRLRFIGQFDDVLVVQVDGKVVLEAVVHGDGSRPGPVTGWQSPTPAYTSAWKAQDSANRLTCGEWVSFEPGSDYRIDITIGERPGGVISGLLLAEEEGVNYEKTKEGRPVWPVFATRPLGINDIDRLEASAADPKNPWPIGVNAVEFNFSRSAESKLAMKKMIADDVKVDFDDI